MKDVNNTHGEVLTALRVKNGYTLDYIASYIGVDKLTYVFYEMNEQRISNDELFKLCELYGQDDIFTSVNVAGIN